VQVIDVSDHAPTVRVVFLGADDDHGGSSGRLSRHARPGDRVATVSVDDADQFDNVTVMLYLHQAASYESVTVNNVCVSFSLSSYSCPVQAPGL